MSKFIVDLELDGYETEEEMEKACEEFIYENLNFTASSVKIKNIEWLFNEKLQINKLQLSKGDIITLGGFTNSEAAKRVYDFLRECLDDNHLNNNLVVFKNDIEIDVLSTEEL